MLITNRSEQRDLTSTRCSTTRVNSNRLEKKLATSSNKEVGLDIEIFPNYALFAFRANDGRTALFETYNMFDDKQILAIRTILETRLTYGFNSLNYDLPIIFAALCKANVDRMYKINQAIIGNNLRPWVAQRIYDYETFNINHVDIMPPNPCLLYTSPSPRDS